MQFSVGNPEEKITPSNFDPAVTLREIEELVQKECLSLLEAVSWWLEERSIPENQFNKFIPDTVIQRLKDEVIEDGVLKPSLTKENEEPSLEFLYD